MTLRRIAMTTALVAGLGLAGCGSEDDPAAKATPTSAAPTPTPSTSPGRAPGAFGITYQVLNYDEHARGGALLAWKQMNEAVAGSVSAKRLVPAAPELMSRGVRQLYITSLEQAWKSDWVTPPVTTTRVEKAILGPRRATLTMCLWAPSFDYRDQAGNVIGGNAQELAQTSRVIEDGVQSLDH